MKLPLGLKLQAQQTQGTGWHRSCVIFHWAQESLHSGCQAMDWAFVNLADLKSTLVFTIGQPHWSKLKLIAQQ